ncbi:MAG TPA: lipoate--protein ligase family protein [Actinomycetota bacterium]|nr:lipoate--protein ligase family protein [Actinomycetota bacterium]
MTEGRPSPPTMDTAISRAQLDRVAAGAEPETLRLHRPGPIVAFGPKDRLAPGYGPAVGAAAQRGFGSVQRLAGGRAAVFHEETIAFSWAIPDPTPREGIRARFEELAALMATAFRSLGVDARVGEVRGEYCPGEHSVNARGRTKTMGVGQRLIAGAAHVGGVVVVGGAGRVREVLVPVYEALELSWDPATAGSLEDEVQGLTWDGAAGAIVAAFEERFVLKPDTLSAETLALAEELAPSFAATER